MVRKGIPRLFFAAFLFSITLLFVSSASAESGQTLQFGTEIKGEITETDSSQTYEITLEKSGRIDVEFSSYISEVNLSLVDSQGRAVFNPQLIYTGSPANPKKWSRSEYLEAGTYYLKIRKYSSYTGTYQLKVNYEATNNTEVEPNNGTEQAQSLAFNKTVTGLISWNDSQDYYEVVLQKPGKIDVEFSSYISEVNLSLVDSQGRAVFSPQLIYTGSPANPKKWSRSEYLEPGTHYLKVSKYSSYTGTYQLTVNYEATNNNEVEPNNGTEQAQNLAFNKTVTGLISWNDSQDYYEIVLQKPGKIDVEFSSYISDVNLSLVDSQGRAVFSPQLIYTGSPANPKKWSKSEYLEAGTYYLKINKYSSYTGTYQLKVNYEATNNNEVEPNNGTEQAQSLAFNKTVTGLISWNDSQDYYEVVLQKPGKIDVEFSSYISEVNLSLVDSQGRTVFSPQLIYTGSPANPKKWNRTVELEAGIYYIKIGQYSNYTGKYSLSVHHAIDFTDVSKGEYYYDAVVRLVGSGVISGYPDGTFRPGQTLSRTHAILLLKKALNLEVPENYKEIAEQFSDVGRDHLYAAEVAAVYKADIFLGNNGKMGMTDILSREQMASVIVRAFQLKDDLTKDGLTGVVDSGLISPSHKKNVEIFYDLGITSGKADGRYAPKESVTRGQFATFLNRTLELKEN